MDPVQPLTRVSRLFFPRSAYGKRIHGRINFSYLSRRRRSIGQLITRDHWIINAGLFSKRSTRTLGGLRLSIIRLYIRPFRAENPGVDLFHARNAIIANIIRECEPLSNALPPPTLTKLSRASRVRVLPCDSSRGLLKKRKILK